jgi:1,4-dihydroxy-2-naphthoyl-CoA hydrolase
MTGHEKLGPCWRATVLDEVGGLGKICRREGEDSMDPTARFQRELPPFPRWLGITVTSAAQDRVVAELTVREELCTAGEIIHGGAIMAFADTIGALGTVMNLREGQGTTTLESKTNFFFPGPVGTHLIAEATPLHRGRRTQVWETRLTNQDGRLVAKVTQTQMVL